MKTAVGLACLLLLLGSAGAFQGRTMARFEDNCNSYFSYSFINDEENIENCLKKPGIAAAVDGYTGTDVEKKIEISAQCEFRMFNGGVLDPDTMKRFFESIAEGASFGAAINQGLEPCLSNLLDPIQIIPFFRCMKEYC